MTTLKEVNENLEKLLEQKVVKFDDVQTKTLIEIVDKWLAGKAVYRFALTAGKIVAAGVALMLMLKQFGIFGTLVELSKGALK